MNNMKLVQLRQVGDKGVRMKPVQHRQVRGQRGRLPSRLSSFGLNVEGFETFLMMNGLGAGFSVNLRLEDSTVLLL